MVSAVWGHSSQARLRTLHWERSVSYTHLSYLVKAGDVIEVAESSRSSELFKRLTGENAPMTLSLIHIWHWRIRC